MFRIEFNENIREATIIFERTDNYGGIADVDLEINEKGITVSGDTIEWAEIDMLRELVSKKEGENATDNR